MTQIVEDIVLQDTTMHHRPLSCLIIVDKLRGDVGVLVRFEKLSRSE